jgi:hypothetical protein
MGARGVGVNGERQVISGWRGSRKKLVVGGESRPLRRFATTDCLAGQLQSHAPTTERTKDDYMPAEIVTAEGIVRELPLNTKVQFSYPAAYADRKKEGCYWVGHDVSDYLVREFGVDGRMVFDCLAYYACLERETTLAEVLRTSRFEETVFFAKFELMIWSGLITVDESDPNLFLLAAEAPQRHFMWTDNRYFEGIPGRKGFVKFVFSAVCYHAAVGQDATLPQVLHFTRLSKRVAKRNLNGLVAAGMLRVRPGTEAEPVFDLVYATEEEARRKWGIEPIAVV